MKTETFLSFKLQDEFFAIRVMQVMEILEIPKITKIPKSPNFLLGVINLRGSVLPLIDTRIKFGITPGELTKDTRILVLRVNIGNEVVMVGALVDSVLEVFELEIVNIKESPTLGVKYVKNYIEGMIKKDQSFMMLLDIDKVFQLPE